MFEKFINFIGPLLLSALLVSLPARAVDLPTLEKELNEKGISGWVHGASPELGLFVFTYRDPGDFFSHYEFPLSSKEKAVKKVLLDLARHDQIWIKGEFVKNGAAVAHIRVSEIRLDKKFSHGIPAPKYKYEASFPKDLEGKKDFIGRVHAVAAEGKAFIAEYKDAVVPVYVTDATHTAHLFRNDKVRVHYVIRKSPLMPTHVELDVSAPQPVEVLERIEALHDKPADITGRLVLFPKSPQVIFNVFALQTTDSDGIKREHTLINFEDPDEFKAIRETLQGWWDHDSTAIVDGRNKFVKPSLCVRATGTFNVVDPSQANPQIKIQDRTKLMVAICP